jgi:hypothetical protein
VRKSDLLAELTDVMSDGVVQDLWILSIGVLVDWDNLRHLCIEDLCSRFASKIVKSQALVKKSSPNLSLLVPRLRTRRSHLTGGLAQCIYFQTRSFKTAVVKVSSPILRDLSCLCNICSAIKRNITFCLY